MPVYRPLSQLCNNSKELIEQVKLAVFLHLMRRLRIADLANFLKLMSWLHIAGETSFPVDRRSDHCAGHIDQCSVA